MQFTDNAAIFIEHYLAILLRQFIENLHFPSIFTDIFLHCKIATIFFTIKLLTDRQLYRSVVPLQRTVEVCYIHRSCPGDKLIYIYRI